ncbi:MAG: fucose isomerase [Lachnospiraceae bacterium]|nr:fucose isomerase [Lachnospiraceae bacterium]
MLQGIDKILTGDILKALCDMGHGDELIIADANFPAETYAKRLIRVSGVDGAQLLGAFISLFPLDNYVDNPTAVMDLTDGDKKKKMPIPAVWAVYEQILKESDPSFVELGKIERMAFYERTKNAFVVIQTSEERQYGNLLLVKGVVK